MARLEITLDFKDRLNALSDSRRDAAIIRLEAFVRNHNDPLLRLRELRCAPGHWLIDSFRHDRIILKKLGEDLYRPEDVGGHDIYADWEKRFPREG